MRVRTGLINDAAPAAQQRQSREEDTMTESEIEAAIDELRDEIGLLSPEGEAFADAVRAILEGEYGLEPIATQDESAEMDPVTEPPPPTQTEPTTLVAWLAAQLQDILDRAVEELRPGGVEKLERGWRFYRNKYAEQRFLEGRPENLADSPRAFVVAFHEMEMAEDFELPAATDLVGVVSDVLCPGHPEPKVFRQDALGRERWQEIPAAGRWLAVELAAQHTGGSGQLPPTPVEPEG